MKFEKVSQVPWFYFPLKIAGPLIPRRSSQRENRSQTLEAVPHLVALLGRRTMYGATVLDHVMFTTYGAV